MELYQDGAADRLIFSPKQYDEDELMFTTPRALCFLCRRAKRCHAGMRSIHETKSRWDATLANYANTADLSAAVRNSTGQSPCVTGLRSICWKTFLSFRTLDQSAWEKILSDSRGAYASLKEHFLKHIENPDDLSAEDPLTDTETVSILQTCVAPQFDAKEVVRLSLRPCKSPWNTLRLDEELRAEIFLDVERCMPDNLYFREPSTQNMLLDILFVYCKLNRDIGYRQGMHEVLAPIIWVVSRDAIDPASLGAAPANLDRGMILNLDHDYVEHDAFTIFGAIMQTVKGFYETGSSNQPTTSGLLNNSPIVERSKRIHENYLHHADPELAEHLTAIEILPQIFLIRWVRLLFGREFPFDDVLALWDILFAEDPALDLVDLVSVAMLLRIRWQLLEADYSEALTLLLRYPVPAPPYGPATFVGDAIYLRDNLLLDGGDHIISKYSRRAPETTVTRKLPKKIKRARTAEQEAAKRALAPRLTPARIFQEQKGGIEGIIHEAAKGVYSRGEKWGVGKALRGAMQGLQSGHTSPRRVSERPRWSLDGGKMITDKSEEMMARIQALEQRNKSLAKLLENAVDELWTQQKGIYQKNNEAAADALGLSIAKVQFVQVYLENSSMPLPTDLDPIEDDAGMTSGPALIEQGPESVHTDGSTDRKTTKDSDIDRAPIVAVAGPSTIHTDPLPSTPKIGSASTSASPPPRPSLEKSPFSWMLGEDQRKSEFVVASPFQAEKSGGESGNLFGDAGRVSKSRRGPPREGSGNKSEDEDDVFAMGTLKAQSGR